MTFNGNRVIQARQARGLRASELAHALGLTPAELADLEEGFLLPGIDLKVALSIVLGFPWSFFHQATSPPYPLGVHDLTPGPWSRYERPPAKRRPPRPHTHCDGCDEELSPLDEADTTGYCAMCRSRGVRKRRTPAAMAAYAAEAERDRRMGAPAW